MKKVIALVLCFSALFMMAIPASAEENEESVLTYGDYEYSIYKMGDESIAVIDCYTGSDEQVIIPSEIEGLKVVEICGGAFSGNETIKSVTIPSSVEYVGGYAFSECTGLSDIKLESPESVKSIDKDAFLNTAWYNAQPYGVVYFYDRVIGYKAQEFDEFGYAIADETVTVKDGTRIIDAGALVSCLNMKTVVLPPSVKTIGYLAFADCPDLADINFPRDLKE